LDTGIELLTHGQPHPNRSGCLLASLPPIPITLHSAVSISRVPLVITTSRPIKFGKQLIEQLLFVFG
jgi:hypothetical protein